MSNDDPDTTGQKTPVDNRRDQSGRFRPGFSGNIRGRPKGARGKLSEAFLEALHEDFQEHGKAAIEAVRVSKPEAYIRVIASLLPRDVNLNTDPYEDLSDEELRQQLRQLEAELRTELPGLFGDAVEDDDDTPPTGQPLN